MRVAARGPASSLSLKGRVDILEGVWLWRSRNLAVGGSVNASVALDGYRIAVGAGVGRFNGGQRHVERARS